MSFAHVRKWIKSTNKKKRRNEQEKNQIITNLQEIKLRGMKKPT